MHAVCKTLFLALLIGLALFVLAFGTPVVSMFTSAKVLQWAGCSSAGFDNPAIRCGYGGGVVGERFGPLSYWFTTLLAPYFLLKHFWDVMLGWLALIALFGGLATASAKGKPAAKRAVAWPDTRPES